MDNELDKYTEVVGYVHTYIPYMYRILFSYKKEAITVTATTWIDLKGSMLSEISQRQTNTL